MRHHSWNNQQTVKLIPSPLGSRPWIQLTTQPELPCVFPSVVEGAHALAADAGTEVVGRRSGVAEDVEDMMCCILKA